jgi:hypothetical protein
VRTLDNAPVWAVLRSPGGDIAGARFDGSHVDFENAVFSGGTVDFREATGERPPALPVFDGDGRVVGIEVLDVRSKSPSYLLDSAGLLDG